MIPVDRAHGGNLPDGVIDFSASINPLGPPPEAIRAYHEAVASIAKYPAPYPQRLEARIAAWLGVDPETVIAANGSSQLIYLVARVLHLRSPFVVIPTFSEIANALIAAGSPPLPIQTRAESNFLFDQAWFEEPLTSGADAVFWGRPNSPTGRLLELDTTAAIARDCADHAAWCVIDEAFIEFADDPRTAATLVTSIPRLLVFRSLTKIFAIPGLRLGYLIGPVDFVRRLREVIEPWSVNAVAEQVAWACLDAADDFVPATRRIISEERHRLELALRRLPALRVFPSSANFLMFHIAGEHASGDLGRYMLRNGIAIRDLSGLPGCGPGFYRVSVRSRADNDRLVAAVSNYLGSQ